MAIGTDRIQIVQGNTAYLNGIIRSRLLAYNTDTGTLVYSPDGYTWIQVRVGQDGILLDGNGKIPLSYFPDTLLVSYYIHNQLSTDATWVISNPFERVVNINFVDSAGNPFICDYMYSGDFKTITATSTWAVSGKAILN